MGDQLCCHFAVAKTNLCKMDLNPSWFPAKLLLWKVTVSLSCFSFPLSLLPSPSLSVLFFYGKPVPGNLHFSHLFSNKPCESLILPMEKRKSKSLYN